VKILTDKTSFGIQYLLLLSLALFSCHSQSERIVDGIDYSIITVSDSIVESDGKVTAIDVKIDYPQKINNESSNIRDSSFASH